MADMDRPNRSLLTSGEAASRLGVERRTLIRMEERGTLVAVRLTPTSQRRYRAEDIAAIIAGA